MVLVPLEAHVIPQANVVLASRIAPMGSVMLQVILILITVQQITVPPIAPLPIYAFQVNVLPVSRIAANVVQHRILILIIVHQILFLKKLR